MREDFDFDAALAALQDGRGLTDNFIDPILGVLADGLDNKSRVLWSRISAIHGEDDVKSTALDLQNTFPHIACYRQGHKAVLQTQKGD